MTAGIPAAHASSAAAALAFISVVMFGFQCWVGPVQTLPSDLFPEDAIASVAGLSGVGAGIGAMAFTMLTGFVVEPPAQLHADSGGRRAAALTGNQRFDCSRRHRRAGRNGTGLHAVRPLS